MRQSSDQVIVAHFDSTGGIVRAPRLSSHPKPFYYSLVTNWFGRFLPLCEFFLQKHTAHNIAHCLGVWRLHAMELHLPWPQMTAVVVDFSYAMIQAVLQAFNHFDLKEYLQVTYEIILHTVDFKTSGIVVIKMCVSHLIKGWKVYIFKLRFENTTDLTKAEKKDIKRTSVKMLCNLILQETLEEFIACLEQICIVFLNKYLTLEVENALELLTLGDKDFEFPKSQNVGSVSDNTLRYSTTLRESSPFYQSTKHVWTKVQDDTDALNKAQNLNPKINLYYCPDIITYITTYYVHIAPLWSAILHSVFNI